MYLYINNKFIIYLFFDLSDLSVKLHDKLKQLKMYKIILLPPTLGRMSKSTLLSSNNLLLLKSSGLSGIFYNKNYFPNKYARKSHLSPSQPRVPIASSSKPDIFNGLIF